MSKWTSDFHKKFNKCKAFIMVSEDPRNPVNQIIQCADTKKKPNTGTFDSMFCNCFCICASLDSLGLIGNVKITQVVVPFDATRHAKRTMEEKTSLYIESMIMCGARKLLHETKLKGLIKTFAKEKFEENGACGDPFEDDSL